MVAAAAAAAVLRVVILLLVTNRFTYLHCAVSQFAAGAAVCYQAADPPAPS
jgi:hypothetical protein